MKVWLFDYHPANDSVEFVHDDDFTRVNELLRCGEPLAEQWSGYEVRVEEKRPCHRFIWQICRSVSYQSESEVTF